MTLPRFRKVALGGTFDTLHAGHIKLLATAVAISREVVLGVTSDEFANTYKQYSVKPYSQRVSALTTLMRLIAPEAKLTVVRLDDPYGPAISDTSLEALIASVETLPRSILINDERIARGLPPVDIIAIGMVRDGLGHTLSSTYIRQASQQLAEK